MMIQMWQASESSWYRAQGNNSGIEGFVGLGTHVPEKHIRIYKWHILIHIYYYLINYYLSLFLFLLFFFYRSSYLSTLHLFFFIFQSIHLFISFSTDYIDISLYVFLSMMLIIHSSIILYFFLSSNQILSSIPSRFYRFELSMIHLSVHLMTFIWFFISTHLYLCPSTLSIRKYFLIYPSIYLSIHQYIYLWLQTMSTSTYLSHTRIMFSICKTYVPYLLFISW